ncbi:MAG: ABC transporter permease, partial [Propionibacteriaceae bacterium]|nr:ABC transporter permease [Propionibacteriaceae bacterium]
RNPLIPLAVIVFGPFFVLLMSAFYPSGQSAIYEVIVVNTDQGSGGAQGIAALEAQTYETGQALLDLRFVDSRTQAEALIADHRAIAYVEFGPDFTIQLDQARTNAEARVEVVIGGDLANPYYPVTAILIVDALERYIQDATGRTSPMALVELPIGGGAARSEFEYFVPGLLFFGIGMVMFAAAMMTVAEVETRTLSRLSLTRLRVGELLGGITAAQVLVALLAGILSLATALALGFTSVGPIWPLIPIWILTSLSVIGIGMVVAAFTRTPVQAFLLANFPFAFFVFLSGTVFPVRGVTLFTVGNQAINLLDFLPIRHGVNAVSKICTFGSTNLGYEILMLTVTSIIYFTLGAWLFHRRHLRAQS